MAQRLRHRCEECDARFVQKMTKEIHQFATGHTDQGVQERTNG